MTSLIRGLKFARYARALLLAKGSVPAALAYAQSQPNYRDSPEVATLLKGAIDPLKVSDFDAAQRAVAADFAGALRAAAVIGRLQGLRPALFNTRSIVASGAAAAAWVGEALPIPLTADSVSSNLVLPHTKISAIAAFSNELLTSASPKADVVLVAELVRAAVFCADFNFVDPTNAGIAGTKPASVTYGAPTIPSTGSALANIDQDLWSVIERVTDNNNGLVAPAWIMHPLTATYLGLLRGSGGAPAFPGIGPRGGELLGIQVVTSTAVLRAGSPSSSYLALVDADEVLLADDDQAAIDYSGAAAIQMVDNPSGAASVVSMFQSDTVAARITRWINWKARRAAAAVVLSGITF